MRLINIHTLAQKEFADPPAYAILSHRWTDEELAFKDYQKLNELNTAGARKLRSFCAFVRQREFPKHSFEPDSREANNDTPDASSSTGPSKQQRQMHEQQVPEEIPVVTENFASKSSNEDNHGQPDNMMSGMDQYLQSDYSKDTNGSMAKSEVEDEQKQFPVNWVWIDTCCIDKNSSSELSEAINSMWTWYRRADYCVAYLNDVQMFSELPHGADHAEDFLEHEIQHSEWFTRGWTLQELLAPDEVIFCNQYWDQIGETQDPNFCAIISAASGIPLSYLSEPWTVFNASIAQRMSWASSRETTRDEDIGYCLLGLFEVNMPLIYGEGKKAFLRLQEEIIKHSDDESIMAWIRQPTQKPQSNLDGSYLDPVLASHPRDFKHSCNIYRIDKIPREPYSITNKGLLFISDAIYLESYGLYIIQVNCAEGQLRTAWNIRDFEERHRLETEAAGPSVTPWLIALKETRAGLFARINCNSIDLSNWENDHAGIDFSAPGEERCFVKSKRFLLETRDTDRGWSRTQEYRLVAGGRIQYLIGNSPPSNVFEYLFGDVENTS